MQRSNKRRSVYRRRRNRRRLLILAAILALVALIVILILTLSPGEDQQAVPAVAGTSLPSPSATAAPTAVPTQAPTPAPTQAVPYAANAANRPQAQPGYLPVFRKAETDEKIIAITVDDCFQAENLRVIVQTAIDNGAKLTIFPIGKQVIRGQNVETLKWAWENGMELENHTYSHSGLYHNDNEEFINEVYMQNLALSKILGQEYQCHFIRPRGGDARNDQRVHAYAAQLGYYGVAHWSASGSGTDLKKLPSTLKPGQIYLFHTTDKDMEKLVRFIPYAVQQGYRLVTLNEMFGYPANETAPLKDISAYSPPTVAPYDVIPVSYSNTSYAWGVYQIQEKLIALGYLQGEPDGVFGDGSEAAIAQFQRENGLNVTGEADLTTQEKLNSMFPAA